jgi:hypothetical protein
MTEDHTDTARRGQFIRMAAMTLLQDAAAAGVVKAFDRAGIPTILLKGPSIQTLLYPGESRGYGDIDLLVAPDNRTRAEQVLTELGFAQMPGGDTGWGDHSLHWWRADGAQIDLHTTIWGVGVTREALWARLCGRTSTLRLGDVEVPVLDPAAVAMHIALHTAQHSGHAKPMHDLERAVERLDIEVWWAARHEAEVLQATPAMALGLQMIPAGAELAERLQLVDESTPLEIGVTAAGGSPTAIGIARLAATPGTAARVRLGVSRLVPSQAYMRAIFPDTPPGRAGLLRAHARRWARIGRELPIAVREQRLARARRARARQDDPGRP